MIRWIFSLKLGIGLGIAPWLCFEFVSVFGLN